MKTSHNNWLIKVLYSVGWLCLVVLVLITCVHTLYLFPGTIDLLTNADIIQLPTMFLDLKADLGNFWGWQLPEAPYYFPDTLVFLLVNWLVQDSWHSVAVYSLVQACLVVFSLSWLYQEVGGKRREVFLIVLLAISLAFTNIYTTIFSGPQGFVAPYIYYLASYIHFGTYICSLICLAGSLTYLRTGKKTLLAVVTTIVFLTTASDLIFAIYFTIPFIITLAIASKARLFSFSVIINRLYCLMFSASLIAYAFNKYFDPLATTVPREIKLSKIILSIKTIGIDLLQTSISEQIFLTCAIILPLSYLIAITVRLSIKYDKTNSAIASPDFNSSDNTDRSIFQFIVCLYVALAVIANIIAVMVLGKYTEVAFVRYFILVYYSPGLIALILVSLALEKIRHINNIAIAVAVVVTINASTSIVTKESPSISQFFSPPDYASCFALDRPQAGLAGYWQSKPLIAFSQRKVQIATIQEQGRPMTFNNNRYWFTNSWTNPGSLPEFQFIFMKSLDENVIETRYGKPDSIEACTDSEIWWYNDSQALYSNLMKGGLQY
jgi:hypothetical protein